MAQVLQSPLHFSSASSSPLPHDPIDHGAAESTVEEAQDGSIRVGGGGGGGKERQREGDQLPLFAILVTILRKSVVSCNRDAEELPSMEIGSPSDVRHVAHVTFDRFNGFLGLPVEFEPEVPMRPPSASTSAFGVSTESMQLSFDSRGNSVPTILLLMQNCLYERGGLQAEGIFRINAENGQEELVREQLNRGVVPDGVDIHCLAGLIKAWFRELPTGVLDSLSAEQVMQSQTEEECAQLARRLPPTEASLLDWAINLMADVAQLENVNKMNAHNAAMVFAPNMTHMADPLNALMHAVQVMNFLKTLVVRTLRDRKECIIEPAPALPRDPSDDNGHQSSSQSYLKGVEEVNEGIKKEQVFLSRKHVTRNLRPVKIDPTKEVGPLKNSNTHPSFAGNCCGKFPAYSNGLTGVLEEIDFNGPNQGTQIGASQSSNLNLKKGLKLLTEGSVVWAMGNLEKSRRSHNFSRINSSRIEAWR